MASSLKQVKIEESLKLPRGTTVQRPVSPNAGYLRFNTDFNKAEIYNGSAWEFFGQSKEDDQIIDIFPPEKYTNTGVNDGEHRIEFFTKGCHIITPRQKGFVDVLVVAGGGGGGGDGSAGGGAGGLLYQESFEVESETDYALSVGEGGAGVSGDNVGNNGNNSFFGKNLVTNGAFNEDVSNWVNPDVPSFTQENGRAKLDNTGSTGNKRIYQSITGLEVGETYLWSMDIEGSLNAYISPNTNSSGSITPGAFGNYSSGSTWSKTFTATQTTLNVVLYVIGTNTAFFDNVSVVKAVDSLYSQGGGGGGTWVAASSNAGGSGGGGVAKSDSTVFQPGTGIAGQGFPGGSATANINAHGGGGGAGGPGLPSNGNFGGGGGPGLQFSISGTPTWYAGGGAGGNAQGSSLGSPTGGAGGGGRGAHGFNGADGYPGKINTGGGGGGSSNGGRGGDGGRGIVIVRYRQTTPNPKVMIFTSTEASYAEWIPSDGLRSVELLMVAGGGGGGYDTGGGGGAGGLIYQPSYPIDRPTLINGDWYDGTTGWEIYDVGNDTIEVDEGRVTANQGASGGNFVAKQTVNVTQGQIYEVSWEVISYTEDWSFEIFDPIGAADILDKRNISQTGFFSNTFTAPSTQVQLSIGAGSTANSSVVFDNIRIRPVYRIDVGAGGPSGTSGSDKGDNGSNTTFGTLTAIGGGGAGSNTTGSGNSGGSGGGSGSYSQAGGTGGGGTQGQGSSGADVSAGSGAGSGGGGAGTQGTTVSSNGEAGNGGEGLAFAIAGYLQYYAAGGGGGGAVQFKGFGGSFVGGDGGVSAGGDGGRQPTDPVPNTGSGGGGGAGGNQPNGLRNGTDGASGVVILRWYE